MAYVQGRPLTLMDLQTGLVEAAGGAVLADLIVERAVEERLAEKGLKIGPEQLAAERAIITQNLSSDPNQAERLLKELRQRRGWGETRFAQVLRRNAGLRLLVQDQVQVTDAAVKQAYRLEYGPRYEARLIVADTLAAAGEWLRRARAGESFGELAARHSTDASRAVGGLLPPISPEDASFPAAVRQALGRLQPGQVSDPVVLDRGYAMLKLERQIGPQPVRFDDVKETLSRRVRLQVERMLMQRTARDLLSQADPIVLDPALKGAWDVHKKTLSPDE